MYFNHYTNRPVELAVNLVNSEQPDSDGLSDLATLEELVGPYEDLWTGVAEPAKASELVSIRELRASLRYVLEAGGEEAAAAKLNTILSDYGAVPRLSLHSGEPHLHFEPLHSTMTSWLGTVTAMGPAAVIVEPGIDRFGVCCAGECRDVFVDTSKNRSRRHCSNTCSTREAVAAHRRRKAE